MQEARHRLCCAIVREHFGQTAEGIFQKLLHGKRTLDELIEDDNGSNNHEQLTALEKSLKTMIQHDIVRYYEQNKVSSRGRSVVCYEPDVDSVEMRLHFPHYIQTVKQFEESNHLELEHAHLLIQTLCRDGQCSKQHLFDLYAQRIYQTLDRLSKHSNANAVKLEHEQLQEDNVYTGNDGKYSFCMQFDHNDFGEWTRCMANTTDKPQRKNEIRTHFKSIWKWLTDEKCFIVPRKQDKSSNGKKRNHCTLSDASNSKEPHKKMRKLSGNCTMQMNENENDAAREEEVEMISKDTKWIVCHRSFLHELRANVIMEFAHCKYDDSLCQIVEIVLQNSLKALRKDYQSTLNVAWFNLLQRDEQRQTWTQSQLEFNNTSPVENRYGVGKQSNCDEPIQYRLPLTMSREGILRALQHTNNCNTDEHGLLSEQLRKHLEMLTDGVHLLNELNDILPVLLSSNSELYQVNVLGIVNRIQLLDVQKLVHCRFDELEIDKEHTAMQQSNDATRIFGAMIAMRKIGDKQLSEMCMMQHSKVKKVLYRMLADKFIEMEYIARSADRDPKKSFFLWSINWSNLHKKVVKSMYTAICNLLLKKRDIRKRIETLENDNSHKMNGNARRQWMRLCAAFQHLTLSVQSLDLQIALHRDF